jgi:PelA/Pel-15E family pectate lyase
MNRRLPFQFLLAVAPVFTSAAVIGVNPPSQPLTAARISALPAAAQPAWRDYLARSVAQRAADRKFLADEIAAHGIKEPVPASSGGPSPRLNATHPAAWFASAEARRMADNIVSFQTPAGGWSKNFNPADHPRRPGEAFSPDTNLSRFLTPGDNDQPHDEHWAYIGTFDNNATIDELLFLARVAAAADATAGAGWRASFLRGIDYVIAAQYPNGGWPQVYPLDGGYHDAITFNDGAIANIIRLLRDVSNGRDEFAWVPAETRRRAAAAEARGIACILDCQLVTDGRRTVWCQQHDALTLAPTSARNYEMPSQCSSESAGLAIFLMELPAPDARVAAAVHAAAAWLQKTALHDVVFSAAPDGSGRKLLPAPGAPALWARYYELKTDRPIFGDRDKTIHDDIAEISLERRNGYSWFANAPQRALDLYAKWTKAHPAPAP